MSWLKKHVLPQRISQKWPIRLSRLDTWTFLEVTDHYSSIWANTVDLNFAVVEAAFSDFEVVALSQRVDQWQWEVGNCRSFSEEIRSDFSINVELSTELHKSGSPQDDAREYTLHIIAPYQQALWRKVARFGMFNLANIAYGLDSVPNNWPEVIYEFNKRVVSWFRLETSDNEFVKSLSQVDLIFMTIDNHLCFCFSNFIEVEDFIEAINDIGEEHSLRPVVEYRQGPVGKAG